MRCQKFVSHATQVLQDIGLDTVQANPYDIVGELVVRHVINIGSGGDQFGAVIEANVNRKRARLTRTMSRYARQELSVNLECG